MTNIEKLVDFIMKRNPDLFPVFLGVLEVMLPAMSKERAISEERSISEERGNNE